MLAFWINSWLEETGSYNIPNTIQAGHDTNEELFSFD
jgi:hypothetical protein